MIIRGGVFTVFICGLMFFCSCAGLESHTKVVKFDGKWQGHGVDSNGNELDFAAKVIDLGGSRYRILILDSLDTQKEPMHVMEGVLKGNEYEYTSDGGMYVGGGKLDGELFEGYYKGPVDGTFIMHRVGD